MSRKAEPAYKTENNPFSKRLREIMAERHTTQKQLAEAIKMRPQTVSLYMNGQSLPDVLTLKKIADYYDVSADWLLDREGAVMSIDADLASAAKYTGLSEDACKRLNRDGKHLFFRSIVSSFISSESMLSLAQSIAFCRKHLKNGAVQAGVICLAKQEQKVIDTAAVIQKLKTADASYKAERFDATNVVFNFVNEQISVEKQEYDKYLEQSGYASVLDLFTTDLDENHKRLKWLNEAIDESESAGDPDGEHPKEDN